MESSASEQISRSSSLNHLNEALVLRKLWTERTISRIELARTLQINKSTVTRIVSEFIEAGLIEFIAEGDASPLGGRKPKYLSINAGFGCVIGIEIRTDVWEGVAVDLHGTVIDSFSAPGDLVTHGIVGVFLRAVDSMRIRLERSGYRVLGVGLGVSGIVNHIDGIIYQSKPLTLTTPVNFYEEIADYIDLPVIIENDANCGCWAEMVMNMAGRAQNFVFVLGEFRLPNPRDFDYESVSVGLGLVLNGAVHHGKDFSAGEFRSVLWKPGNTTQFSVSDDESHRIRTDPELHRRMLRELCDHLGFLVNVLNLDAVIFGSSFEFSSDYVVDSLRSAIQRNWSYPNPVACDVRVADLGDEIIAYGAAGMLLERLFSVPSISAPEYHGPTLAEVIREDGKELSASMNISQRAPDWSFSE